MSSSQYRLPIDIRRYLKHLLIVYEEPHFEIHREIIEKSMFEVTEEWSEENWNGGSIGHALTFYVPENILKKTKSLSNQNTIRDKIKQDLNNCSAKIPNEYIDSVFIELYDNQDPDKLDSVNGFEKRILKDSYPKIWKPGYVRLFVSHRDKYKEEVGAVKTHLEKFGISCFVAHDCIEALSEWQNEIEIGLSSADLFLAYLTDDFIDSEWTDQEVGYALARQIPVIPLKVQKRNPYGLLSKIQALKGRIDDPEWTAGAIFERVVNDLPKSDALRDGVVEAFCNSKRFEDSIFSIKTLFPKIKKLSEENIQKLIVAFRENDQLHNCLVVNKELPRILKKQTSMDVKITKRQIRLIAEEDDFEIPF